SLRAVDWPAPGTPAAQSWQDFLGRWHTALSDMAEALKGRRIELSTAPVHEAFESLETQGLLTPESRAPLRLALHELDMAIQTVTQFSNLRLGWRDSLPRFAVGGLRGLWLTLAAQFSFRSMTFRHALRVAVASGIGLWLS